MRTVLFDLTILETETRVRGVGRYIIELAGQLEKCRGLRVLFLEHLGWCGSARITDDASAAIARLSAAEQPFTNHMPWAYRLRIGLWRALRRSGADLLHLPHSFATPLFGSGLKRIVTCHDLIPLRFPEHYATWKDGYRRGRRLLDHRRFNRADHIIAISKSTAADLQELLNVPPHKISVVYNAVDLTRWLPEAGVKDHDELAALGLEPRRYLLYAGDADWRKNHRGMFGALAIALQRMPGLRLVCAGRLTGTRHQRVSDEARRAGVADAVELTGHVADGALKALYRHALATLFVSYAEGFGLPVLEAMATGSPLITSDCSSMAEISQDAALLVPPSCTESIARAILALAESEDLRRKLVQRGIERARQFSVQRQVQETEAVYLAA